MIAAAVAAAISAAAVVVSARQLLRLGRLRPTPPSALEAAVRASNKDGIARALDQLFPWGWSPVLADALLEGRPSAAAVAELNELFGDVDGALRAGEDVSKGATRIALFAGSFGAIVELLPAVGAEHPSYGPAIAAAGFGLVGAILAGELGRRCRERVGDVRSEWDQVATVFTRRFGGVSAAPPSGRRGRAR